ncbi:MAG: tetratricopeptide repeat protein [Deferribacteraceae bacterium]|jgi:tetratricopeptide (TPR) repeat protein|nr:tetratricopeptide repeat protein [Deferribacteraceae bacterium]
MHRVQEGINAYLEGDVNTAIKLLTGYISDNLPPQGQAYYYLGLAHCVIGKNTEAGGYFSKALELEPEKGMYHYKLALVYSDLMLFEQAIPHLLKTLEQNPQHVRARFVLGTIYFKTGNLEKAVEEFLSITRLSPDFAQGYYELGQTLFYMGDTDRACGALKKAAELAPENRLYYYRLAQIYSVSENGTEEMLSNFEKAYELGMDDLPFLCHYIIALKGAGKKGEAEAILAKAEEIYPTRPELSALKEVFNKP